MLKSVKQKFISRLFCTLVYKRTKVKLLKKCYTLEYIKAAWPLKMSGLCLAIPDV